jgi:hypothetical protein
VRRCGRRSGQCRRPWRRSRALGRRRSLRRRKLPHACVHARRPGLPAARDPA